MTSESMKCKLGACFTDKQLKTCYSQNTSGFIWECYFILKYRTFENRFMYSLCFN